MKRPAAYLAIALVLLIAASLLFAQSGEFQLPWRRIAGGGGSSSDGEQFVLSGTIGQAEAGVLMEGSSFQLSGGYWGGAACGRPPNQLYLPLVSGAG
jgi:hypothetical protein